ncbi:MAG: hypothetical protein D6785_07925 [Planctomycetota bacterium]|nr:MAG: hypothetical protein D6785_07925 [Planctomycetota bacterium]
MKKEIPIFITMVVGIFMILKYFLPMIWVEVIASEIEQWGLIVISFAFLLGMLNILRIHLKNISRKGDDWFYSSVMVISLLGVLFIGLFERWYYGRLTENTLFDAFIYKFLLVPLSSTMFALLAFFIASAAFRAFRARTLEATLLLLAGTFVMIGRVPLGIALGKWIHLPFGDFAAFIMETFNKAGQRGIIIGAAMGIIATGLRVILGIERPYLKGE